MTISNASQSAETVSLSSAPTASTACSRPIVLEIVIPFDRAKKRARLTIGVVPPCFRSIPGGPSLDWSTTSAPRKPSGGLNPVADRARSRSRPG